MDSIKLKPCPFCGKEAKAHLVNSNQDVYMIIQCENCKANLRVPVQSHRGDNWSIDLEKIMQSAAAAAMKWNYHSTEKDIFTERLDRFRERIERQINETVCKRDVLNLCETSSEKERTDGFIGGLEWLLEIMDDEETAVNDDEEDG